MAFSNDEHERYKAQAVAIEKLMDDPHGLHPVYAESFKKADIIFGLDVERANKPDECYAVFYGKGMLQEIAHRRKAAALRVFVVAYHQSTDELEALVACCKVHLGWCDYPGNGD